ncbi:MAG: hypothetical protein HYU66_19325 [Armatimonadetes bacterium]|nr:hypothetical protein [Armatimonadota bacterium]
MGEHRGGHKGNFEPPAAGLAERFPEDQLLEYYRQHRRYLEVLEGKLTELDFDAYRQEVGTFVGRRRALEALRCCFACEPVPMPDGSTAEPMDRGIVLLTAGPGVGKTALLTHWIDTNDACPEPVRFYWRRGRDLTRLDFFRHLYHSLLRKHNIEDAEPSTDENEYPRKIESLLKRISERHLAAGECEIIVVDGLDEAGDSRGRQLALSALPRELPANVFLLVSSRDVPELVSLRRERHLTECSLDAEPAASREDVAEYLTLELVGYLASGQLSPAGLQLIADVADGNFLWAKQFCLALRRGLVQIEALAATLPRIVGLETLYEEFWQRALEGASEELRQAVWRAAGVLSVAQSAVTGEQITRVCGLEDARWMLVRQALQQYLDTMALPDERDSSTSVVGYRIYHQSFRDFLQRQPERNSLEDDRRFVRVYEPANVEEWDGYGLRLAVHHAIQAQAWDHAVATLTSLRYCERRAAAGQVFDLAADFRRVCQAMQAEHPWRLNLRLLDQALRRHLHFIGRHREDYPQALFQCLWNEAWWYDTPKAEKHYDTPDGGWGAAGPPWERSEPKLCSLLERWRAEEVAREPKLCWLRSHRPPSYMLGGAELACLRGHEGVVHSVAYSPTGDRIVSGSDDGTARVWNAATGAELTCLRGHQGSVLGVAFSPAGDRIASGSNDHTVRVWDVTTGAELACFRGHRYGATSVAFSPAGDRIVSGGRHHTVLVWDAATGAELARFVGHQHVVTSVGFSPAGERIVSGSADGTVRVLDASSGVELACLRGHNGVNSVAFSPVGDRVVSGEDATVKVWDATHFAELACCRGHESAVTSAAFSPDGGRLVTGSYDDTVRVWDAIRGAELACLRGHEYHVTSVAFSPAGDQVVSASFDGTVRIWDLAISGEPPCLRGHQDRVTSVAFPPAGDGIVSGSFDHTVRVWDATNGTELACLRGHEGIVHSVAFSPAGDVVVSGSFDLTVRVWDAASGSELACLRGHDGPVSGVAFSPSCDRIASGSWDHTVRVWDVASGVELACLRGHEQQVESVSFPPAADRILSMDGDDIVRVWNAASWECMEVIPGPGDLAAIAAGPDRLRLRAMEGFSETVVERSRDARFVAAVGLALHNQATHPTGRTWAGAHGQFIEIIALEGDRDP